MKNQKNLWFWILMLVALTPIGLLLPSLLRSGGAWGEWGADELEKIAGFVPAGFRKVRELWNAPFQDYSLTGWDSGIKGYISYIITGIIGVAAVVLIAYAIGRILQKRK